MKKILFYASAVLFVSSLQTVALADGYLKEYDNSAAIKFLMSNPSLKVNLNSETPFRLPTLSPIKNSMVVADVLSALFNTQNCSTEALCHYYTAITTFGSCYYPNYDDTPLAENTIQCYLSVRHLRVDKKSMLVQDHMMSYQFAFQLRELPSSNENSRLELLSEITLQSQEN